MRKHVFILLVSILLFSCKEEEKKSDAPVMAKQSEMSALMLKMYEENAEVKKKIINGEELTDFPAEYLNIHKAVLTDPSDRTPQFNAFSELYLSNQKLVFEIDKDSVKEQFNKTVNSCIACHQMACPGPIPRIQKLLIK